MRDSEFTDEIACAEAMAAPSPAPDRARQNRRSLARFQTAVALALAILMAGPFIVADLAAHLDWVSRRMSDRLMQKCVRDNLLYVNEGPFQDVGDRLLLRDLPQTDDSKGGVHVVGSSSAIYCLDDYRLTPPQARVIHNDGLYGINPTQLDQFLHLLVNHFHLIQAGGDKTLVIIGLAYTDMIDAKRGFSNYFPDEVTRGGLFTYDPQKGVLPVKLFPGLWTTRLEITRSRSVLGRWTGQSIIPRRRALDPARFQELNAQRLGPHWNTDVDRQLIQLAQTLDYLQALHINVLGLLAPEGSWTRALPGHDSFVVRFKLLFKRRGIELLDVHQSVPDDQFNDAIHCAPAGTHVVQALLMKRARAFLHTIGALTDPEGR